MRVSRNKGAVKANRKRTDREKLELFVDKVNELRDTTLMRKNGLRYHFNLKGERDKPVEFKLEEPDEGELRDYLMTFRRFVSNEDVSLNHIINICQKRLTNVEQKQQLPTVRQLWSETRQHSGLKLVMNGKEVSAEKISDMWLNGRYFHDDLDYRELLDSLPSLIYADLREKFLNFVIQASRIIIYMGLLVDTSLQAGSFQFDDANEGSE